MLTQNIKHQIPSAPGLTDSSATNHDRVAPTANTKPPNTKISWRIKLVKVWLFFFLFFLQSSHISHQAVMSWKQHTLPKLTGQSCKSTPYLRFDEEGWATVHKSSSQNARSDHATLPTVQDKGNKPGQSMSTEEVSCLFVVIVHRNDVWFVCLSVPAPCAGEAERRGRYPRTRLLTL